MEIIKAQDIYRTFVSGNITTHVLKGVSLDVQLGEFVAIMGKSGAGKSTFMYQLSILDHPTSGTIIINGTNTKELNEHEQTEFRLNTLGYIFQDYALVPDLSATENCMLPLLMKGEDWDKAKNKAVEMLTSVGLETRVDNLPSQLSGGEQQRVAIARALAGNPKIIFADEPTANLDTISGNAIIDLLGELNKKGQTIVMVTHEEEYTKYCNRIVRMEDGKIIKEEVLR
ncbi:MAG: Lipoprotein-releasing system ATP-binding protein LolD [Parcubacteria bacterium OLB19]|nr:MAG: Lipoprotein-releasing system ATP-binding protein LolD [Parcubacteria bacterium OLB19]